MPPSASEAVSYATTSDTDFYEILGISSAVISESLLRKAFRKQSLKWHPDKNPDPAAVNKFHMLTVAYDVISDPATHTAYDNARAARLAKKRRSDAFDLNRRKMQEDLESREKRVRTEDNEEERFRTQLSKLQQEGARLRHKREEALMAAALEEQQQQQQEQGDQKSSDSNQATKSPVSRFSELDRTVTIRWRRKGEGAHLDGFTLGNLFSRFGKIQDCVVKAGGNEKKYQSGLIVFESIVGAHAAVRDALQLYGNEFKWFKTVAWATGKEPDLSGLTELDPPSNISPQPASPSPVDTNSSYQSKPTSKAAPWVPPTPRQATSNDRPKKMSFPSFTSKTASKPENPLFSKSTIAQSPDYESITLMRMRDAEMRRLETEIRNLDSTSADG